MPWGREEERRDIIQQGAGGEGKKERIFQKTKQ
jgi:hypothetical protein